jgi:hypothetical protein
MAVEISLKHKYSVAGSAKRNPSRSSTSGTNKHKGETNKERLTFAQQQTKDHQRRKVVLPSGKFRWELVRVTHGGEWRELAYLVSSKLAVYGFDSRLAYHSGIV